MNFKNILNEIEKVDTEVFEKTSHRRDVLKGFGGKIAIAALPFALGSLFKKAYGKTTDAILDVLNFALELEYLEYNFYHSCNISPTLSIAASDQLAFSTIETHEYEHVNFLRTAISSAGGTPYTPNHYVGDPVTGNPYTPAAYDFTVGGLFPVYTDYATFLAVSQVFEDTGVRAYKGQAGNLKSDHSVLTAALQIHSVEARHASHVRNIRMKMGADVRPWITLAQAGIQGTMQQGNAIAGSYAGEDATTQAGVNIVNINGQAISANAASEAFDEPLDKAAVANQVAPFFLP